MSSPQPSASTSSNAASQRLYSSPTNPNTGSTGALPLDAMQKKINASLTGCQRETERELAVDQRENLPPTPSDWLAPKAAISSIETNSQKGELAIIDPQVQAVALIKANQIFGLVKVMIGKLKLEQLYPKLPLREALLSLILDSPSSKPSEIVQVAQKAFDPACAFDSEKITTIENVRSINFLLNQGALLAYPVEEIVKASDTEAFQKSTPDAKATIELLLKLCAPMRAFATEIGNFAEKLSNTIEQNMKESKELFLAQNLDKIQVKTGRNERVFCDSKKVTLQGEDEARRLKNRLHSLKPQLLRKIDLFEQNLKKVLLTPKPHQEMLIKLLTCTTNQIAAVGLALFIQIEVKCSQLQLAQGMYKVAECMHGVAQAFSSLNNLLLGKPIDPLSKPFEITTKLGQKISQHDMNNTLASAQSFLKEIKERLNPFCNTFSTLFVAIGTHLQSLCQQGAIPDPIHKETLWLEVIDFAQATKTERTKKERRRSPPQTVKAKSKEIASRAQIQHSTEQAALSSSPIIEETFFTRADAICKGLTNSFKAQPDFQSLMKSPLKYEAGDALRNFKHHLYQAFMGMHMLQQTLLQGKVRPLMALLPTIVMDITVCLEQIATTSYLLKFGMHPLSHSLLENLEATGRYKGLTEEVKGNLFDLNKGNIWARYPLSSQRNFTKGATPRGLFLINRSYELLAENAAVAPQNIAVLLYGMQELFASSLASMGSLLKTEVGDLSFCRLPEMQLKLEPMTDDSRIASCLTKLKERLQEDCLKDCYYHLVRLNQAKALSLAFPEPLFQACHYRMALNLSLIFELALMQIAKERGAGLIFSHDFEDFYPHLPRVPQKELLNRFCLGKALHYPHDAEVPSVVQAMLTLEKSGKGFRHAPPGFTAANSKGTNQFDKLMGEVFEEGLDAFQDLVMQLDAPQD